LGNIKKPVHIVNKIIKNRIMAGKSEAYNFWQIINKL